MTIYNTNFKKYCDNRKGIKLLSNRHRVVAIALTTKNQNNYTKNTHYPIELGEISIAN
ncbi:MAG: hypothetical protein F6K17_31515 [Okeania sp. SIO3C4]|nr:hypothetical protein [Okeania sp. SIO3C4]